MDNTFTDTEVYKLSHTIILDSLPVVAHISKVNRYTIGSMYMQCITEIIRLISYAYVVCNNVLKEQHLINAFYKCIDTICYLRILKDTNNISNDDFVCILNNTMSIKNQICNWIKSINPLSPIIYSDIK